MIDDASQTPEFHMNETLTNLRTIAAYGLQTVSQQIFLSTNNRPPLTDNDEALR